MKFVFVITTSNSYENIFISIEPPFLIHKLSLKIESEIDIFAFRDLSNWMLNAPDELPAAVFLVKFDFVISIKELI